MVHSPYAQTSYGNPLMAITGIISGASGLATAITSPLTARQNRLAAEAGTQSAAYQAQASMAMSQAQLMQSQQSEKGKSTRFMFGIGGAMMLGLFGLAAFLLTRK